MKFSDLVAEYVTYKRALGMRFDTEDDVLASFCRRLGDVQVESVTVDQVRAFLGGGNPVSSSWERKKTVLGGLYRFALARGYSKTSPLPLYRPKVLPPLAPYIYSQAELRRLLDAAPAACSHPRVPLEAYVLRILILLLYGACLRLGEAQRLTMNDVDLAQAVLCIRESKFYNYAAFLAMPIRLRLDHDDAGKEPAGRHSQVAWIGIVLMAKDP